MGGVGQERDRTSLSPPDLLVLGQGQPSPSPPPLRAGPLLLGRGPKAEAPRWQEAAPASHPRLCMSAEPPGETPVTGVALQLPLPLQVEKSLQRIQNGQRNAMYTSQQSVENKVGGIPGWQALLTAVGFRLDPPASGLPAAVFFPTSDPGDRLQQCSSTIQSLLGESRAGRAGLLHGHGGWWREAGSHSGEGARNRRHRALLTWRRSGKQGAGLTLPPPGLACWAHSSCLGVSLAAPGVPEAAAEGEPGLRQAAGVADCFLGLAPSRGPGM